MFDDPDGLLAHSDMADVLPYLADLHAGDTVNAISKLKELVASDNKYAAYVLGNLFLFGKTPRYYLFNKSYEVGEVKRKSLLEIQEEVGFQYWVGLLRLKGAEIEDFHLEGLYDLYKVMQGTSEFFKTNDISCRPQSEDHPMFGLFNSQENLRDFLYRQNHCEIYLDVARDALKRFKESPNRSDMDMAVGCLNNILSGDIFSRYSQYEIAHANFEVGKLYLYGNAFFEKDMRKAIFYLTESKLDAAHIFLLDYYKQFGDKFIRSMRKCIGMVRDDALRQKLYQDNNIEPPKSVDIAESLNLLAGTRKKPTDLGEYGLEGDFVVKIPKVIDGQKVVENDIEIANSFEMIETLDLDDLDSDAVEDFNLGDDDFSEDDLGEDDFSEVEMVFDLSDEYENAMEAGYEIVEP